MRDFWHRVDLMHGGAHTSPTLSSVRFSHGIWYLDWSWMKAFMCVSVIAWKSLMQSLNTRVCGRDFEIIISLRIHALMTKSFCTWFIQDLSCSLSLSLQPNSSMQFKSKSCEEVIPTMAEITLDIDNLHHVAWRLAVAAWGYNYHPELQSIGTASLEEPSSPIPIDISTHHELPPYCARSSACTIRSYQSSRPAQRICW